MYFCNQGKYSRDNIINSAVPKGIGNNHSYENKTVLKLYPSKNNIKCKLFDIKKRLIFPYFDY